MGRIEIDAYRAAPLLDDPAPLDGRVGKVVPARPFVVAEDHRTVLDGQLHPVVLGELDDARPDLQGILPVLVGVLRGVGADERVHQRDVHLTSRHDHLLQVADDSLAMRWVGVERVRVVPETGDREAFAVDLVGDLASLPVGDVDDVDVARARIATICAGALRPTGNLEDLETGGGGPVGNLHQRGVRERGSEKSESHHRPPTGGRRSTSSCGVRITCSRAGARRAR